MSRPPVWPVGASLPDTWRKPKEDVYYMYIDVPCNGSCGDEERHTHEIRINKKNGIIHCDCPARRSCYHIDYLIGFCYRRAKKKGLQDSSLNAWRNLKASQVWADRLRIYDLLKSIYPSGLTDHQISAELSMPLNVVNPRRGEARKLDLVQDGGKIRHDFGNGKVTTRHIWIAAH